MSSNDYVPAVSNAHDLKFHARQLAVDSLAILRSFDLVALIAALAFLSLLLVPLEIGPLWSIGLAALTYVGTTLLRPHPAPLPAVPLRSDDEIAYELGRDSCAGIQALIKEIADPAVRRNVRAVHAKFTRMLDVMDLDQKFVSTGDYYSKLIHPFERLLHEYVRLSSRKVPGASKQLAYFEADIVPRTEAVAEAFYQDYHQMDVIDLAALMEIHRLNLDSLSPDDEPDDKAAQEPETVDELEELDDLDALNEKLPGGPEGELEP